MPRKHRKTEEDERAELATSKTLCTDLFLIESKQSGGTEEDKDTAEADS